MIIESDFRPAWWLRGAHAQTLWPHFLRHPRGRLRRERLELPDGDFLDLDWRETRDTQADAPLVLVLHGLEGSSRSGYARGLLNTLARRGLRAVLMHFRGCSGEPNRLARSYHSGDTADLAYVVKTLLERHPVAMGAVGFSLGGNVLLKWLGEQGSQGGCPLRAAAAVSVPFVLHDAAARLDRGASRLYQWALLGGLRRSLKRKIARGHSPIDPRTLARLRNFYAFDHAVTAPLHGFASADDYYTRASSRPYLRLIRTPTLILHAKDDPFMSSTCIPQAQDLAPPVRLELAAHGGHVGFVCGRHPWRPQYWLDQRLGAYFTEQLRPDTPMATA